MKIVFIASRSINEIGGIENYMRNLCPLLGELGHEVILYASGESKENREYKGVKIVSLPKMKSKYLDKVLTGVLATFHALIFQRNVSVYHYNANAAALLSFLPRLTGHHVVFQGHGFEWKRNKWPKIYKKVIRLLDYFVIYSNRNFTMVSEEQSQFIRSLGKSSTTITPGINMPPDENITSEIFARHRIKPGEYILFLGRLVQEKKPDALIAAFRKIRQPDLQLVIAGDNLTDRKYIQQLHERANGDSRIIFTGAVHGSDKEALLKECQLFCIPSELEGLPIALLEAMSYGKYCIASDITANKEALENTGIFFRLNDIDHLTECIESAICHSQETMCMAAKQRVENYFTWPQIAKKFDQLYRSIV